MQMQRAVVSSFICQAFCFVIHLWHCVDLGAFLVIELWSHRLVGRDLKACLIPSPLPWTRTPFTGSGCSKPLDESRDEASTNSHKSTAPLPFFSVPFELLLGTHCIFWYFSIWDVWGVRCWISHHDTGIQIRGDICLNLLQPIELAVQQRSKILWV